MKTNRRNEGFALIEVLLAVVILAVGITLVLRSFQSSAAALKALRSYANASGVLEDTWGAMQRGEFTIAPGDSVIVTRHGRYSVEVERVSNPRLGPLGLDEVYVKISWDDGRRSIGVSAVVEP